MTKELKTNNRSAAAEKTHSLLHVGGFVATCSRGGWGGGGGGGVRRGGGGRGQSIAE